VSTQSPELHDAVAARLGLGADRLTYRALSRGVTHDTMLVRHGDRPVAVLRRAPRKEVVLPGLDMADEGRLLEALPAPAVPRPRILLRDPDGAVLGRPGLLLAYVEGTNPRTWEALRAAEGDRCAEHALEVLVALHRSPPLDGGPSVGLDASADGRLAALRRHARRAGPYTPPALLETIDRLAARIPAPAGECWTHGDFRPSNLVVGDGRITAVLDWEMGGRGDPARDLGIATMADWGVWWPDDELLDRYRAAGGPEISLASLRWWRCMGYAMVVTFLATRLAGGWPGGAPMDVFLDGLARARDAWEEVAA
jgi:aminoglycoside phosphotransferase (APT) family kinase protein